MVPTHRNSKIRPRAGLLALAIPLAVTAFAGRSSGSQRANAAPTAYKRILVGTLGGDNGFAYGLNASGEVTGSADDPNGVPRAYLWKDLNNNGTWESNEMFDLQAGDLGYGEAINDYGQVAGEAGAPSAFLWTPSAANGTSGTLTQLAPNAIFSSSHGMNATGQVVGEMLDGTGSVGFVWTPDTPHATTGTLTPLPGFGFGYAVAWGINSRGQIAGFSKDSNGKVRAVLWTPVQPNGTSFDMADLGAPDGQQAYAYGINDAGMVVGYRLLVDNGAPEAFRWTPGVPNGTTGTFAPLGTPANGGLSSANSVNANGEIVGSGTSPDNSAVLGAYYDSAVHWQMLQPKVQTQDVGFYNGAGILNDGRVVGQGAVFVSGQVRSRGTVLVPVSGAGGTDADLSVIFDSPTPSGSVVPGQTLTFRIVATNNGPANATNFRVHVDMDSNLVPVDFSVGSTVQPITARTFSVNFQGVASGVTKAMDVDVTVATGAHGGTSLSASMTADQPDPNTANNIVIRNLTVGKPTKPTKPGSIDATVQSATSVQVTIGDSSNNEDTFEVQRKASPGGWSAIASVPGHTGTGTNVVYVDNAAAPNTIYLYRVSAKNAAGSSAWTTLAHSVRTPTGGSAPDIAVADPSDPNFQTLNGVATFDFGQTLLNATQTRTMFLTNTAATPVSVTLRIGAPFKLTGPTSLNFAANETKSVPIDFKPTAQGDFSDSLVITETGHQDRSVPVHGAGAKKIGVLSVKVANQDELASPHAPPLAWGPRASGQTYLGGLVLTNTGGKTLTVAQAMPITGGGAGAYQVVQATDVGIDPAKTKVVVVTFTPPSAGSYPASVRLHIKELNQNVDVPLSGTGT